MDMPREWTLITKEHITTHTNYIILFKLPFIPQYCDIAFYM